MTEITQADRDAAAKAWAEDNDEPLDCHICEQIRAGYGDNSLDVIRLARHRMEERAAIVEALRDQPIPEWWDAADWIREEIEAGKYLQSECPRCCGNGQTYGPNSGEDIICPDCNGKGMI